MLQLGDTQFWGGQQHDPALRTAGFSWQLSLGIDNVFEEEPPPGTRTGRFTGGSPYYDPIGRFYYGGLKVSF